MSIHWIAYAWEDGPSDATARYVYVALADNANDAGECYPSMPSICEKTRLSESTVRRAIVALEEQGWLTVDRGCGKGNRSHYFLQKVSPRKVSEQRVSPRKVSPRRSKGVTVTLKGCHPDKPPYNPPLGINRHRTVIEPSDGHPNEASPHPARAGTLPEIPQFVEAWNRLRGKLPKVEILTEDRRRKLALRCRRGFTLEKFERAVKIAAQSPFLNGDNRSSWKATFDWLVANDTNLAKILEGNYAAPTQTSGLKFVDLETIGK